MELRYNTIAKDYISLFNRYAAGSVVAERFVRVAFFVIPALAWLSTFLFYTKQRDLLPIRCPMALGRCCHRPRCAPPTPVRA